MIQEIDIDEALHRNDLVFVDVRSESEFEEDTIIGSYNIPVLNDEERKHVGYVYTQINKEEAKRIGLEYASRKLVTFYDKADEIRKSNKNIALFCFRGGMRSNSIARVLEIMGIKVYLIKGGYKSYRKYVVKQLYNYKGKFKYIVLHGYTGTGKTKILSLLEKQGKSILNLEELAHNSGSVFGNIAFEGQSYSQKKFESLLLKKFQEFVGNYVFTESESKKVGRAVIPNFLMEDMEEGYHILIDTCLENRVKNIMDDYISISSFSKDIEIEKAIMRLTQKLGIKKVDVLIEELNNKNYSLVIRELMISYYDPLYRYSIEKIDKYDDVIEYSHIENALEQLNEFVSKLNL